MIEYLCIENYFNPYTFHIMFKKGEIYQTSFRYDYMANGIYIKRKNSAFDVRFDEEDIGKYFIPLAEWREQQIKSVLDD